MEPPLNIAVLGAGLMGHGIAQVFAAAGHSVVISDPDANVLANAAKRIEANLRDLDVSPAPVLARISTSAAMTDAVASADIIVEAAPEKLAIKRKLFSEIATAAPPHAVFASNTSVIPITQIGEDLPAPARARLLGTHWWNPPYLIPLVEVVRTEYTDPAVFEKMFNLLQSIGKLPVKVQRDVTGFIGNRLQYALWREAFSLIENGVCDAETIDTVIKNGFGARFPVLGPMENADLIGLELAQDIYDIVVPALNSSKESSRLLAEHLENGKLGMKSGEGLRAWTPEQAAAVRSRLSRHLATLFA